MDHKSLQAYRSSCAQVSSTVSIGDYDRENNGLSEHHNGKIASSPLLLTLREIRYCPLNVSMPMGALEALNGIQAVWPTGKNRSVMPPCMQFRKTGAVFSAT
jgi:hypothetical protein